MKYIGLFDEKEDIVTKEKLEAVEAAIPTKTSQLTNDSGFITDTEFADKVSKSGDTMTGKLTVPQVETGAGNSNFFQCRKFRGEGDANSYYHAIDFGYKNHDQVDFHEYGGKWNFYKNQSGKVNEGVLCGSITSNGWEGRAKLKSGSTMVTSQLTENSDAIATTAFVHGLVDNVKYYSANNPPPYPVTSVNGQTGAVTLSKGDVGLGNVDNVKQYSASNPPPYPVTSVNSKTGAVSLTASDVGAIPVPTAAEVGQTVVVKAVDENGKPTEWEPVTLPEQVQANWNQNDSTAVDYVKNRTHYEESAYVDYVLNMNLTNIVGFSMPEVGETTTVKINGVESVETVKETESSMMGGSYKYIGNIDIDSLLTGGTGWIVAGMSGQVMGVANPDTTIAIENLVVHKINDKFINFDGFVRTFDYYFKNTTLYKPLYNDNGSECLLYMCNNFILPEVGSQLFGFMDEIGFSRVAGTRVQSCFVTGYIISGVDGSIEIRKVVLGTDTSEMERLAADYGFTHTTNPKA